MRYGHWKPYVPVAERREKAKQKMLKMQKEKGITPQPIEIQGRKITKSFWGRAWCDHLESFSDYANRLPRGRTYTRNGSVCHLDIKEGNAFAIVSGSELYNVTINISKLTSATWKKIILNCTGKITNLLSLLQGKLPEDVLKIVTRRDRGLLPSSQEITYNCNCPDHASMCKHIAAVFYGIGARLDHQPELLFTLRGVDQKELISKDIDVATADTHGKVKSKRRRIASDDLANVFGVEMADQATTPAPRKTTKKSPKKKTVKKIARKKAVKKTSNPFEPTGPNVISLRKKFSMTPVEFALLLKISTPTVHNWEAKPGKLNLRNHTKGALMRVSILTKNKAWKVLEEKFN